MPTRSKTPVRPTPSKSPAKSPAATRSLVRPAAPPPSAPRGATLTAPPPSAARGATLTAPRAAKPSAPPPPPAKKAAKAEKAAKPAKADKAARAPKKVPLALVRDGFTMPAPDFALIAKLKTRALEGQRAAKKSELLRAGLRALAALDTAALVAALDRLEPVKTGRPKKRTAG